MIAIQAKNSPQDMVLVILRKAISLEKEMPTHSLILALEIPWTEGRDGLQSMGSQELDTT